MPPTPRTPFDRQVIQMVKRHGYYSIHVIAEDEDHYAFTYTVGLWPRHPELILTSLDPNSSLAVLAPMCEQILRGGRKFEPGRVYTEVLAEPYTVEVRNVAQDITNGHLKVASWYAQRDVAALQAVWPDLQCRFPWDDEYDEDDYRQPLLAL